MAKIDLDSLGIEELAALREDATDKLMEKVAVRRAELEADLEKLSQYGKPVKRSPEAVPVREGQEERREEERRGQGAHRQSGMSGA
jgi:hypothetical protein